MASGQRPIPAVRAVPRCPACITVRRYRVVMTWRQCGGRLLGSAPLSVPNPRVDAVPSPGSCGARPLQSLETTLVKNKTLADVSLAVLYAVFTLAAVPAPKLVSILGPKCVLPPPPPLPLRPLACGGMVCTRVCVCAVARIHGSRAARDYAFWRC